MVNNHNFKKKHSEAILPLPANQIWRTGTSQRRTTCLVRPHLQHNNVNFKKSCIRWCQIIRRLMTFLHLQRSYEISSGINCSFFRPSKQPGVLTCTIYTIHPGGNLVHKHKQNGANYLIFHPGFLDFPCLYYYMRNFCNVIGLEEWYFSLI